jgi:hypothetical protein
MSYSIDRVEVWLSGIALRRSQLKSPSTIDSFPETSTACKKLLNICITSTVESGGLKFYHQLEIESSSLVLFKANISNGQLLIAILSSSMCLGKLAMFK